MKKSSLFKIFAFAALLPMLALMSCSQNGKPDYAPINGIWEKVSETTVLEDGTSVEDDYAQGQVDFRYIEFVEDNQCYVYFVGDFAPQLGSYKFNGETLTVSSPDYVDVDGTHHFGYSATYEVASYSESNMVIRYALQGVSYVELSMRRVDRLPIVNNPSTEE